MVHRETAPVINTLTTEPAPEPDEITLKRPIVLVGLMGAGKSSVGKRLAAALGVAFLDSDAEVEAAASLSIPEIFETLGEDAFRDGERRVIARLLDGPPRVIATGGGAYLNAETRAAIAAKGVAVWLDASLETLWGRVKGRSGRPLLETADPRGTLAALLAARAPIYAEAETRVESAAHEPHEAVVARIIDALRARDAGLAPDLRSFEGPE